MHICLLPIYCLVGFMFGKKGIGNMGNGIPKGGTGIASFGFFASLPSASASFRLTLFSLKNASTCFSFSSSTTSV